MKISNFQNKILAVLLIIVVISNNFINAPKGLVSPHSPLGTKPGSTGGSIPHINKSTNTLKLSMWNSLPTPAKIGIAGAGVYFGGRAIMNRVHRKRR